MSTVKVNNIAEARELGEKYGVKFPTGQGRPPMQKLINAAKAAGVELDFSDYTRKVLVAAPGTREYVITATYKKTGTSTSGKPYSTNAKRKLTLTVGEIRELSGKTNRPGRISESSIKDALRKLRDAKDSRAAEWTDEQIEAVQVERKPVADKAAEKPAKAKKTSKPRKTSTPKVQEPDKATETPESSNEPVAAAAE